MVVFKCFRYIMKCKKINTHFSMSGVEQTKIDEVRKVLGEKNNERLKVSFYVWDNIWLRSSWHCWWRKLHRLSHIFDTKLGKFHVEATHRLNGLGQVFSNEAKCAHSICWLERLIKIIIWSLRYEMSERYTGIWSVNESSFVAFWREL